MTQFLYVMDPITDINPQGDTSFDFLLESQARGVRNLVCHTNDLFADGAKGFAIARETKVQRPGSDGVFQSQLDAERVAFDDCAAIFMRKDPPIDEAYFHATMILDRHDKSKTLMVNDPSSLRVANEKLWSLFADDLSPRTVVSANREVLKEALLEMGKGVLKPLALAGGGGIMVFDKDDKNINSALDLLTEDGTKPALCQAYEKDVRSGDKRVIVLGGKPIGALMRIPSDTDNRANMHVGGSVAKGVVDEHDIRICERIGPELVKLGIHFVGIDVIGGKLTEVNVTSPTGVQEIDRFDERTGSDRMSAQVMDYVFEHMPQKA